VEVFLTTKGTKKNKRHKKNNVGRWNHKRNKEKQKAQKKCCWEVEPQKEQRKTKGTKKMLGGGTTKKTKQSGWCWGSKSPSPECNESPEVKKNLVLQGKKSDQRKLLFTLEKLVF
jgi:hypothetical protein